VRAEGIVDDFVSGWNKHDGDAWGNLFAEDAVWVTTPEDKAVGRVKITSDFKEAHSTWAKDTKIVQSDVELRKAGPDVDVILFRAGFLDEEGKLLENSNRALLFVVVKQADGWRITAGQLSHPSE
jgi:uncharacterized protein (TIGR02246 family)